LRPNRRALSAFAYYAHELRRRGWKDAIVYLPHDGVATNNITGKREDRFSHIYIIGKNTCQACVLELPGVARRRAQLSFGDGFDCGRSERSSRRPDEDADAVLADEEIVAAVYEALGKRRPKSRCRGRRGVPADVVLRLLILKHRATRC
jgi:hypothetical protein